jgi:Zn-dependent protease with chaperone function
VTAHELGHLDEPWPIYLARLSRPYVVIGMISGIPLGGSFGVLAGLTLTVLGLLGISTYRKLARKMEVRADLLGRENEGDSSGTYARALEKIHEGNLTPAVISSKRQIHPDLYDRMLESGVRPGYPRPDPPPGIGLEAAPLIVFLFLCFWGFLALLP